MTPPADLLRISGEGLEDIRPDQLRAFDRGILDAGAGALTVASMRIADVRLRVSWGRDLLLVMWVVREPYTGPRRGWLSMLIGEGIDRVPLRAWAPRVGLYWKLLSGTWAYDEVRAWVPSKDPRAKRFAERLGFHYDAGPCPGILPDGQDGDLHTWRRRDGKHDGRRGRQGDEGGSGAA